MEDGAMQINIAKLKNLNKVFSPLVLHHKTEIEREVPMWQRLNKIAVRRRQ